MIYKKRDEPWIIRAFPKIPRQTIGGPAIEYMERLVPHGSFDVSLLEEIFNHVSLAIENDAIFVIGTENINRKFQPGL